jgi:membrane fusion protein (multidrug efflux system)
MKYKIFITIMAGMLLAGGGLLFRIDSSGKAGAAPEAKQKKPPEVGVASALRSAISRTQELTCELAATESAIIAAVTEGPIAFCPWREGDRVEAGQRLIEIDRGVYRAEVLASQATVAVARAKLADMKSGTRPEEIAKAKETVRQLTESTAFSKVDFERTAKLVDSGALPGEALEKAHVEYVSQKTRLAAAEEHLEMLKAGETRTALAVQEAAVAEAEARHALAQAKLAECTIAAPFAGTITKVHIRPGSLAVAKAPLVEITDLSSVIARFAVPETTAPSVFPGMHLELKLDAYPGKVLAGEVVRVYPDLDRRMRTRTVEARITGNAELMPGMFGRVKLNLETADDAVILPADAVLTTQTGSRAVFIVEEGKAIRRVVETGIEEGNRVQIVAGINPGDKVVVAGNEKLKDGAAVSLSGGERPGPDKGKSQNMAEPSAAQKTKAGGGQ